MAHSNISYLFQPAFGLLFLSISFAFLVAANPTTLSHRHHHRPLHVQSTHDWWKHESNGEMPTFQLKSIDHGSFIKGT